MNKTKIEWTDYSWNPVTGCLHRCSYCYARKIATRFRGGRAFPQGFSPTFHPDRLPQPKRVRTPSMIFVCSMGDLFGSWVPSRWIDDVLDVVKRTPRHTFQFLTKASVRLPEIDWPPNCWVGVTAETPDLLRQRRKGLLACNAQVRFASIEPIFAEFPPRDLTGLDWVIVGPQTGPRAPGREEFLPLVQSVVEGAKNQEIPTFVKPAAKLSGPREFPACV